MAQISVMSMGGSNKKRTAMWLLAALIGGFLLLALSVEPFLSQYSVRSNPVWLTRRTIEECEKVEDVVISGIKHGKLSTNLATAFGVVIRQAAKIHPGFAETSEEDDPKVIDGWKRYLQMADRRGKGDLVKAPESMKSKTNDIIIWSVGPNGINEYGSGDDIYIRKGVIH